MCIRDRMYPDLLEQLVGIRHAAKHLSDRPCIGKTRLLKKGCRLT